MPDSIVSPTVYQEAIDFLFSRIDYERATVISYDRREFRLDRMRELLARLDNPQMVYPIIHIAGTKGKGSTAAMIAGMLTAAGYRTGLYTSPHLERIEERMAIDGAACSAAELVELVGSVRRAVDEMDRCAQRGVGGGSPTYFEVTTAMALVQFARRRVDAAVIEVGLGGRLDSTNVCQPVVSVITSISFDHMKQLGNTLASIAREKAGIIKPGVPVVSGVIDAEPRAVIRATAAERNCALAQLGEDFDFSYLPPRNLQAGHELGRMNFKSQIRGQVGQFENIEIGLLGSHQAQNAAVALATVLQLREQGWTIPESAMRTGLANARCPARVEILARRPTVIVDAAHNAASIASLLSTLDESFTARKRWLIFATTQDKQVREMLGQLVPQFDGITLTRYFNNPRYVPVADLEAIASDVAKVLGPRRRCIECCDSPTEAWQSVRHRASADDLICITGSFFLAAEMRRIVPGSLPV